MVKNQLELTNKEENILKDLHTSILEACGVTPNISNAKVLAEAYPSDATITSIPVMEVGNSLDGFNEQSIVPVEADTIGFVEDSAAFKDKEAALDSISAIVDYMEKNPNYKLLIVGCTARVDNEDNASLMLSQQRSDAVASLFVENGISPDRIKSIGVGSRSVFYEDNFVDGVFDENLAKANRKVVFLNQNSSLGQSLLEK